MNERIEKLWDEAAKLEPDPSWQGQTRFMEKFAELIVIECAKQLDVYKMMKLDSSFYGSMLREHFGVKR